MGSLLGVSFLDWESVEELGDVAVNVSRDVWGCTCMEW